MQDVVTEKMAKVGGEIPSMCGKCKAERLHIVHAKVGDKVVKCQCKVCNAIHKYRRPAWVKEAVRQGKAKADPSKMEKAAKKTKSKGKKRSRRRRYEEDMKPRIEADTTQPIRPYSMRQTFEPAQRIEHKKFGEGVVEAVEHQKMTVFFTATKERKKLAHGR